MAIDFPCVAGQTHLLRLAACIDEAGNDVRVAGGRRGFVLYLNAAIDMAPLADGLQLGNNLLGGRATHLIGPAPVVLTEAFEPCLWAFSTPIGGHTGYE